MQPSTSEKLLGFTSYQKFVIAILAFLQFTIILDFMIISPLGAILMPALNITTAQFGFVVSVYAFSAGTAGILAAGFADKYDRKKMLLFFYAGFIVGTLCCGLAPNYHFLVAARLITGLFGGVIGSIVFAITTDLFPMEKRGRVMGFLQTAFAASQILGIPAGLFLSNHWGWHMPFIMIVVVSVIAGGIILFYLKPIDAHLALKNDRSAITHLFKTVSTPKYLFAFSSMALLSIGGFMLMPFASAFTVNNMGVSIDYLPTIYLVTGIAAIVIGPLVGKLSDMFGHFKVFVFGSVISIVMVLIYTNLGVTSLLMTILINVIMFLGIFSRMIPSQTLMSGIPDPTSRGAFMAVSTSLQQVAGGVASVVAGWIIVARPDGFLEHFEILGYVMTGTALITLVMMYFINRDVAPQLKNKIISVPLKE